MDTDGTSLAVANSDGTVQLWDLDAGRVTRHICDVVGFRATGTAGAN
ncbi:WD40 repeat protein [Streptomyces umbrinus]|nr:WD40 repeat protein [Streptomyces umbrinus]GHH64211.1 hypothetical protein GCM10018775_83370 [Streptomyces umbrinus]